MKTLFILLILPALFITKIYSQNNQTLTDDEIIALYKGLRVADVSDGLDIVGLRDQCILDQRIQALWKDFEKFDHQVCGIALTVRYVPTNKIIPNPMTQEEFSKWESEWYTKISSEPFVDSIKNGKIIVIDNQGDGDTGSVGSLNSLFWVSKGAKGIVSNGGIRDVDEIVKERIPVYMDPLQRGRGIRPGRNEVESFNKPVVIGGVLINPGDIIVADGDGVIAVPRKYAENVALAARKILIGDKKSRLNLYKTLGIKEDKTVLP